ncbi:MAG: DUF2785 domain-containing protein [Lactobacillaceae bacterium]|jgi:hypothetical protein|nr:DUF2785 domain-containing protein [Lactobacillaceae bacterium]
MEYTVEDVRHELQILRQRVHSGELFDSLGSEVGKLIDTLDYDKATPVVQLTHEETEPLFIKISDLQEELQADNQILVSDQDLLLILNGLRQTDPELRDRGVFFLLADGLQGGMFTDDQIILMMRYLLQDSVIFSHITELDNDGVFLRSFAVFVISMLTSVNRTGAVDLFTDDLRETLIDQMATYIALERDGRGFVGDKGWAHAFMHIGNFLDEITSDTETARADKIFLETILIERLKRLDTPLIMGENRRLATYFVRLINTNKLYATYFLKQLKQWRQELTRQGQPEDEEDWNRFYNQSRLLGTLLLRENLPKPIYDYLNEARNFLI